MHRDLKVVDETMITALKTGDLVLSGVASRNPHGTNACLTRRTSELDLLDGGDALTEEFRQSRFIACRVAEGIPFGNGLHEGLRDPGMIVAKHVDREVVVQIEQSVAVNGVDELSRSMVDEDRVGPVVEVRLLYPPGIRDLPSSAKAFETLNCSENSPPAFVRDAHDGFTLQLLGPMAGGCLVSANGRTLRALRPACRRPAGKRARAQDPRLGRS